MNLDSLRLSNIERGIVNLETGGRNIPGWRGHNATGLAQIIPHWGKRALMESGNPLGDLSEAQLSRELMNPETNIMVARLMLDQNLKENHGNLNKAIREYSGGGYGLSEVMKAAK